MKIFSFFLLVTGMAVTPARAQPPTITTNPANQIVQAGGNATFRVAVSGTGPFTYQWRRGTKDLSDGIITTVAGSPNTVSYTGDGGVATNAGLYYPTSVAVDASGNFFIADWMHGVIRKVSSVDGVITTVAGATTNCTDCGDGDPATSVDLNQPQGVAVDTAGNLFIADTLNNVIRKVDSSGILTTVAGTGVGGYSGDNGNATQATMTSPTGVALDAAGNLFIADWGNDVIRKIATNGVITTVAGNGVTGYSGDNVPAVDTSLNAPFSIAVDTSNNLFIADERNCRIRKVGLNGIITTVAGNGTNEYSGNGVPATIAGLADPEGITVDASGNLFIADTDNFIIREVDTNDIITIVAGTLARANTYCGAGGDATFACLYGPEGVTLDAFGNIWIADTFNNCIRKVTRTTGPVLELTEVSIANTGTYAVVVTGPDDSSVTSFGATLTLYGTGGCGYSLNPSSRTFAAGAGSGIVSVIASNGCAWTAVSNDSFITITSGTNGTGNGTIGYSITTNTTSATRVGTLTIAGETFTVTQAVVIACQVAPVTTSANFSASGGSSNITVIANGTNCAWATVSNDGFITITSPASSSGNGTVNYTVTANTNTTARAGTMTVAGQLFTINQAAAACTIAPAATSANFSASGGSSNITVIANGTNCAWTAVSNNGFITITSPASGSGNGTVNYTVTPNTNTTARVGTMTVASQLFTISQAAAACAIAPTTTNANFNASGGSSNITVTANGINCIWTAASKDSFITIIAGTSGSGIGTVNYTVTANTNTTARTGEMTIAGQTFTISQAAASCLVTLVTTNVHFDAGGGSSNVVVVANGTNCAWTAISNNGFITITSGSGNSGNGFVNYTVAAHTNAMARTGTMTIGGATFTVTQSGMAGANCQFTLSATSIIVPAKGGTKSVSVKAAGVNCEWTAISHDPFIMITSSTNGVGKGKITYTIAGNTNTTALSGTMTIAGQTFTVNQAAGGCTYALSPKSGKIAAAGGSFTVKVSPKLNDCAWSALSNDPFITITSASGVGKGTFSYSISPNTSATTRSGSISIAGATYTITQAGEK